MADNGESGGVGIGYVHGGMVHEPFMKSLINLWVWDRLRAHVVMGYFAVGGLYVAINRNKVCEEFLKKDGEWLWFLDTDIVFEEETLYKLLKTARDNDCKILSALYFGRMRDGMRQTQPVWLNESHTGVYETMAELDNRLRVVDAVGMGCCLIHREVLEKMRDTYTQDEWRWFSHDVVTKSDGKATHLGEDVSFCRRAKALGYKIYGTGAVIVGHIKSREENLDTFVEMNNAKLEVTYSAA